MQENVITFNGSNKDLFCRTAVKKTDKKVIVPETHNAILVKDGQLLQTLSSGKYDIADLADAKEDALLEVLFLSKTAKLKLLWGTTQKIVAYDKTLNENYSLGLSGDFEVQIGDPRKCFLFLIASEKALSAEGLQERLMSNVVAVVEQCVLQYIDENLVAFNKVVLHKKQLSQKILFALRQKLADEYGISVFSFNIINLLIPNEEQERLKSISSRVCSFCGKPISNNSRFCQNCGREVGENVCPNCQTTNSADAKFCKSCGQKLGGES